MADRRLAVAPRAPAPRRPARRPSNRAIRQHQHQQQPTPGGATSSHRAGASASHHCHSPWISTYRSSSDQITSPRTSGWPAKVPKRSQIGASRASRALPIPPAATPAQSARVRAVLHGSPRPPCRSASSTSRPAALCTSGRSVHATPEGRAYAPAGQRGSDRSDPTANDYTVLQARLRTRGTTAKTKPADRSLPPPSGAGSTAAGLLLRAVRRSEEARSPPHGPREPRSWSPIWSPLFCREPTCAGSP
jgi:hypothetical protein